MERLTLKFVVSWLGLWASTAVSAPAGYYLGWAEVAPIERGIEVSFNPIDCNVCSFAVILRQSNGVLVAHFDVPLIASSDESAEAQEEKVVARDVHLIIDGSGRGSVTPPTLVLGKPGARIDVSSIRPIQLSQLTLLTADSVDVLPRVGHFDEIQLKARRSIEADPFKALESFTGSAKSIPAITESSPDARKATGNGTRRSDPSISVATQQCDQLSHDAQSLTVPTLARVWPTNNNVGVSGLCHVLLFYGLGPTDLPSFPSGELALKALTDEEAADKTFGKSPFIRTRNGVRYLLSNDPVFHTDLGEAHRDQCLATFAALNLPLDTPIRLKCRSHSYSISDLLAESVANFSFDQREPAWTAIAYAKYLPPKNEWINRFHERTSFSQLVNHLLAVDITRQSCAGTHIFEALVRIHQSDRRMRILDEKTRTQLHYYVRAKAEQIVRCQEREGAWNWNWCDSIDRKAPMTLQEYILVTGHILEALNALDSSLRPPDSVFARAAGWLNQSLVSKQIPADDGGSWLCPFTHAARCLRCRVGRDETHLRRYAPTNFVTLTGDK